MPRERAGTVNVAPAGAVRRAAPHRLCPPADQAVSGRHEDRDDDRRYLPVRFRRGERMVRSAHPRHARLRLQPGRRSWRPRPSAWCGAAGQRRPRSTRCCCGAPRRPAPRWAAGTGFRAVLLRELIDSLLDSSAEAQPRFAGVLRELFEFAQRGNLSAALASDKAVRLLQRGLAGTPARVPAGHADPARRGHARCSSWTTALRPLSVPAAAGGPRARGDQRAGRAAGAGREVAVRHADDRHRAWRVPARAVPAEPQEPVPVAGEGALPGVHAPPLRARLQRGGGDHPGQRLQPALGRAARRGAGAHPHRVQRRGPGGLPGPFR